MSGERDEKLHGDHDQSEGEDRWASTKQLSGVATTTRVAIAAVEQDSQRDEQE